jgi:NADH dehydrogenase FAD-containing subunit
MGALFILGRVVAVDCEKKSLRYRSNSNLTAGDANDSETLSFDYLSINVGSVTMPMREPKSLPQGTTPLHPSDSIIYTRPVSQLVSHISKFASNWYSAAAATTDGTIATQHELPTSLSCLSSPRIVVVGGGSAGVELVAALRRRFPSSELSLLASSETIGILHRDNVSEKVKKALRQRQVSIYTQTVALGQCQLVNGFPAIHGRQARSAAYQEEKRQKKQKNNITKEGEGGKGDNGENATVDIYLPFDLCVMATGAAAPPLLQAISGLTWASHGFIQVDGTMQAAPGVFAAGDCAEVLDYHLPKAGVYAVREAPIVAENIMRIAEGQEKEKLLEYQPQRDFMALLNLCDGVGIGTWKSLAFSGGWVWWLKNRIDSGFMQRFQ